MLKRYRYVTNVHLSSLLPFHLNPTAALTHPIENENLLEAHLLLQLPGGDRHGVEEAEAHRLLELGVVPGRPDHGVPVAQLPGSHCEMEGARQ